MKREFEYIKTLICYVFEDDVFKGEVYSHRECQCDKCTGACRAYFDPSLPLKGSIVPLFFHLRRLSRGGDVAFATAR